MKNGSLNELPLKNFLGLNLRDSADKIRDNEFVKLQNVWQSTKGSWYPRFGSVIDVSSVDLCSRISGVWKHYSANQEKFDLYHCVPDSTLLPDNTVDLILTDVASASGDIFGGGAVQPLCVSYSWIGRGMEQTYNSKNRAGYITNQHAWLNPGHQQITLGAASNKLQVQIPAFPTGITGANIFVSRGNTASHATPTDMTYVGTITTSAGTLIVSEYIAPYIAGQDNLNLSTLPVGIQSANGTLKPGTYYVSAAWITDAAQTEGNTHGPVTLTNLGAQGSVDTTLGAVATSSETGGALSTGTAYDFVISVVDSVSGLETFVSSVITGTTDGDDSSLDLSIPSLPVGASPLSKFNVYFGANNGTLYLVKSGLAASGTYNQGPVPLTSGTISPSKFFPNQTKSSYVVVNLNGSQNAISFSAPTSNSSNGARAVYVFVGTRPPTIQPITCVGFCRVNGTLEIDSIPIHNAQSSPEPMVADRYFPYFNNVVNSALVGGANLVCGERVHARFGFLMAKRNGGALQEVFPSRSLFSNVAFYLKTNVFNGDSYNNAGSPLNAYGNVDLHNFAPNIRTQNDLYKYVADSTYVQPFTYDTTVTDPIFCFHLGISYFSNGVDIPWQTDGYTLGQMSTVNPIESLRSLSPGNPLLLPPIPRFIFEYQNSLVVAGSKCGVFLFASNASAPQNWSTGGVGSLQRFVTIGDALGSGLASIGIFTPVTQATDNPSSFMIAFKKTGTWMINTIPDPQTSVLSGILTGQVPATMIQVSGRVGCTAYRTIVQTPSGTVFLGQDGGIYIIKGIQEPIKVGTKIQNGLSHLVSSDTYMQKCTAVFHAGHYKLSFPSVSAIASSPIVNDSEFWLDMRNEEQDPMYWVGPHSGRNIGAQVVRVGDNDDTSRLVAHDSLVKTMTLDSSSALDDLGTAITSIIESKTFRFGEESHSKRYLGATIDLYIDMGYTNNLLLEGFADDDYQQINRKLSQGGAVWNVSQWGQGTFGGARFFPFSFLFGDTNLNGQNFRWRITKSDKAPFILASLTLLMRPERRRVIL